MTPMRNGGSDGTTAGRGSFYQLWVLARRSQGPASAAFSDAGLTLDRRTVAEETGPPSGRAAPRIAVISMHASPTASLGHNANGGLNVYVHEICSAFSDRGVATDVFTRRQSADDPNIEALAALSRVIYLPLGSVVDKYALYDRCPAFAKGHRDGGADADRAGGSVSWAGSSA